MPLCLRPLRAAACAVALLVVAPLAALAQPQPPVGSSLFAFPGLYSEPASGISAGRALADRWLGEDPATNPAFIAPRWGLQVTPVLLHSSRQDLRAANTDFDETGAFLDLDEISIRGPLWTFGAQRLDFAAYAHRSYARSESNAFVSGRNLDPSTLTASVSSETDARENVAGLAFSLGGEPLRVGLAGEWVMRDDTYHLELESGDPSSGVRETSFDGGNFAVRTGVHLTRGAAGPGRWEFGVSARYVSAIEVEGTETFDLLTGSGENALAAERAAGWEYGGSASWQQSEVLRLFAGAGGRGERAWEGFGVTEGAAAEWALALEYHDAADPWTVRLGGGGDSQSDAPEDRATRLAAGVGWALGEKQSLQLGAMRRVIHRDDAPNSFDDRLTASVRIGF